MFDVIFDINCTGFTTSLQNTWSSDFDIFFEDVKRAFALDNCDSLPSALGPKHLSFKFRVVSHIVATTLFSRIGLSPLYLSETPYSLFTLLPSIKLIYPYLFLTT